MSDPLTAPAEAKPDSAPKPDAATDAVTAPSASETVGRALRVMRQPEQTRAPLAPPEPPKLERAPDPEPHSDPMMAFGQPAMWLAIFGGLATRQHLTAAVTGAASVMAATQRLDAEAARNAMAQWKMNSENAWKLANYEQKRYADILSERRTSSAEKLNDLRMTALAMKNPGMVKAGEEGGLDGMVRYAEFQRKQKEAAKKGADGFSAHAETARQNMLIEMALRDWEKDNPDAAANPRYVNAARFTLKSGGLPGHDGMPTVSRSASGKPKSAAEQKMELAKTLAEQEFLQETGHTYESGSNSEDDAKFAALTTKQIKNQSAMAGRNIQMTQRVITGAADAVSDIKNVVELPISIDTGIFGGRRQGPSLMDATKDILANTVTAEEAQAYNTQLAGLERALGNLATGGLAVDQTTMSQFGKLQIQKGDTNLIKLRKIATMRQNVDNALDAISTNPQLGEKQRDMVDKLQKELSQAVPWTPHDVNLVEFSNNPNMSVSQFAGKKLGKPSAPASPSSGGWSVQVVP